MVLAGNVFDKVGICPETALIVNQLRDFGAFSLYSSREVGVGAAQILPAPVCGPSDKKPAHKHRRDEHESEPLDELVFP